jgi:hypothetical protein
MPAFFSFFRARRPFRSLTSRPGRNGFGRRTGRLTTRRSDICGFRLSSVFLGLDHQFYDGPPLLFETMIFDERSDDADGIYQERCATWNEAEAMHKRAIERARALLDEPPHSAG